MPLFLAVRATKSGAALREVELIGRDLAIGRSPEADVTLPDPTQQVSARHCQVQFRDGGYVLADSSTNGTLLNGVRIATPERLKAGDTIGIGHYTIEVADRGGAAKVNDARMDLNSWNRASAPAAMQAPSQPRTAEPHYPNSTPLEASLVKAMARLAATRARQRDELGVRSPDPLVGNPLIPPLGRSATPLSEAAVTAAVEEIEQHHAVTVRAMQRAFRATLDRISPKAIEKTHVAGTGDAREAALWRAYVKAFTGGEAPEQGFVEAFARAFRDAYEELARDKPSSATHPPS